MSNDNIIFYVERNMSVIGECRVIRNNKAAYVERREDKSNSNEIAPAQLFYMYNVVKGSVRSTFFRDIE